MFFNVLLQSMDNFLNINNHNIIRDQLIVNVTMSHSIKAPNGLMIVESTRECNTIGSTIVDLWLGDQYSLLLHLFPELCGLGWGEKLTKQAVLGVQFSIVPKLT